MKFLGVVVFSVLLWAGAQAKPSAQRCVLAASPYFSSALIPQVKVILHVKSGNRFYGTVLGSDPQGVTIFSHAPESMGGYRGLPRGNRVEEFKTEDVLGVELVEMTVEEYYRHGGWQDVY